MIELKTSNSAVALACFRKIAGPLDVSQQTIAVQAETNSIFLRSGTVPPASKMPLEDAQDTVATRN
jgi:hypothetical protein